ncbi:hypothetical protein LTR62_004688 [Meristemomyces frigidus]|uniref:Uncharacterized protein n=1 Tax=Meristemomyces frigidus TaxID=1508187 RepID=A0AAN7YJR7_9PEZI|nr:hypothetical protein LTR62_004688 [Meristemomyces frigidus]
MPTHRPFLSNFLAAFRAHSQTLPNSTPSISSSAAAASAATIWTSAASAAAPKPQPQSTSDHATSSPRPINAKANTYATTTSTSTAVNHPQTTPSDRQLQHLVTPTTHLPLSPTQPVYGPQNKPTPSYPTVQEARARRARRGSTSSSDSGGGGGFREVRAAGPGEKWFIGGRTARGEERYYQLGMVRREGSVGGISADRLSL